MLMWTNFGSFASTYLIYISRFFQKFHFSIVVSSLQTQKGLELVFRLLFL